MQLNTIYSSVINNVLYQNVDNILYEPSLSLLDNICYQLPYNFFVFTSNDPKQQYSINSNNVVSLQPDKQDFYDYKLNLCNNIEHHARPDTLANAYHINTILMINTVKNYKKEDRYIISSNLKNTQKVFFNNTAYETLGRPDKSTIVPLGIPTEIFKIDTPVTNRKPVAILDRTGAGSQIQGMFAQHGVECDIVDPINGLNIDGLNYTFNKYKTIIDLGDYCNINLLCALSCGCRAITLTQNFVDCPFIERYNDIESLIREALQDKVLNQEQPQNYIEQNHNFNQFSNTMSHIFKHTYEEAYIL